MSTTHIWRKQPTATHLFNHLHICIELLRTQGYRCWEYSRENENIEEKLILPITTFIICCEETGSGHNKYLDSKHFKSGVL